MPNQKKKKAGQFKSIVQSYFGDEINHELRQLIDLAVRKQFDTQHFVERFANTHYFRQKFPGLIERNGTIANGLLGEGGVRVSVNSLSSAISAYKKGLEAYQQAGKLYGFNVTKDFFAASLKKEVSATEFKQRLQAVDTIDSNPALEQAFKQQARAQGVTVNKQDAYRAQLKQGSRKFMDIYEAAQYQANLGLGKNEATALAKHGTAAPGGATFQSIDQVVQAARQNLQAITPELAAQGIGAAQLVKILSNPTANPADMEKIQQALEARKSLFGQPVQGTYGQQGTGGGLTQYRPQGEAAYG